MPGKSKAERRIGKGRTFQQRLDDEMRGFAIVYQQVARSVANRQTLDKGSVLPCEWANVFDIDLQSLQPQESSTEGLEQIAVQTEINTSSGGIRHSP